MQLTTNRANTHAASQSEAGTEIETGTGTERETAPQARVKLIKANAAQAAAVVQLPNAMMAPARSVRLSPRLPIPLPIHPAVPQSVS